MAPDQPSSSTPHLLELSDEERIIRYNEHIMRAHECMARLSDRIADIEEVLSAQRELPEK